jgi:ferredoxin
MSEEEKLATGEVLIKEEYCLGCGYCAEFCPTKSITISTEKFNSYQRRVLFRVWLLCRILPD